MSTYTQVRDYVEASLLSLVPAGDEPDERSLSDDRGATIGEYIVITLASLTGAAVVGGIIWLALRNGAETVVVESPAAP
jgi:hypothetical protein